MLTFLVWGKSNNYENRSIKWLVSPLMICHLTKICPYISLHVFCLKLKVNPPGCTSIPRQHCGIKEHLIGGRITCHGRLSHLMILRHNFVQCSLWYSLLWNSSSCLASSLYQLTKHGLLSFKMAKEGRAAGGEEPDKRAQWCKKTFRYWRETHTSRWHWLEPSFFFIFSHILSSLKRRGGKDKQP